MHVKEYFSEIQNLLRRSAFIENADVKYDVEAGIVSYIGRRKKGLIQLWDGLRTLITLIIAYFTDTVKGGEILWEKK
jgi:hypothetical protein